MGPFYGLPVPCHGCYVIPAVLVYIHIPYCHRICPYCSFFKHTAGTAPMGGFVDALIAEANHRLPQCQPPPRTLYLGGGTPSMLSPGNFSRLFTALEKMLDFTTMDEVALEANPATFDLAKARLWRASGVTRVSLGIQSFDPRVLTTLGREHTVDQAIQSVGVLRDAEIPSVNIDLMFSIPGQSHQSWLTTLEQTIALNPDHVSAYNLTYEEDTAFFNSLKQGTMNDDEDRNADQFFMADTVLTGAGFSHYETSNYARPGHLSAHNQGYWQGEDYLGLGPSAVTTSQHVRLKNIAHTPDYITRVRTHGHALTESEILDPEARRIERIAMGLRTREGIPISLLTPQALQRAHHLAAAGLLELAGDRLVLINRGRALVDPVAAELL